MTWGLRQGYRGRNPLINDLPAGRHRRKLAASRNVITDEKRLRHVTRLSGKFGGPRNKLREGREGLMRESKWRGFARWEAELSSPFCPSGLLTQSESRGCWDPAAIFQAN